MTLLGYASLEIHGAKRNGQELGLTVHLFGTILQSSKFHSIQLQMMDASGSATKTTLSSSTSRAFVSIKMVIKTCKVVK